MRCIHNKKGQAIAELAIFGSLMLFIFGLLLSYVQRFNDQQYVQMEGFRRALEKGDLLGEVTGASVQLTLIQNRRYADTSESFRKGSPQTLRASSNVFWAVPEVGTTPTKAIVLRVNEDENDIINTEVKVEDIDSNQETNFSETSTKEETPSEITNTRTSKLKDTVTTKFLDEGGSPIWEVTQGAYRDGDQYKYSSSQVGNEITRARTWKTEF